MTRLMSREDILAADDLPSEIVEVPEWGGAVRVRGMTAAERNAYLISIAGARGDQEYNLQNIHARLCAICLVDEEGQRLFSDADVEALGAKSSQALQRVFNVAQRLSAVRTEDAEELTKNSLITQGDASPSS